MQPVGRKVQVNAQLTMIDGRSFADSFEAVYGYVADIDASRGYAAARVIDRIVGSLTGELSDRAQIAALLQRALQQGW